MPGYDYNEIIRSLRQTLPARAFRRSRADLAHLFVHFLICIAGYLAIRSSEQLWVWLTASFVIGHSVFCLGITAHMLTHGAVLPLRSLLYPLEVLSWSLSSIPATVWRITHNAYHHKSTNAAGDALYARRFRSDELTPFRVGYSLLMQPSRHVQGTPTVLLAMLSFIGLNTLFILGARPGADASPRVSRRDKAMVLFEIVVITALQLGIYLLVGQDVLKYVLAGPATIVLASGWSMAYAHTQHMSRPVTREHDPFHNALSVYVPRWVDWMHQHVSHHVEHHLFPRMSSEFYPEVRKLLLERYGDEYPVKGFGAAWLELWRNELRAVVPDDAVEQQKAAVNARRAYGARESAPRVEG